MTEKSNCLVWFDLGSYPYLHFGISRSLNNLKKMNFVTNVKAFIIEVGLNIFDENKRPTKSSFSQ